MLLALEKRCIPNRYECRKRLCYLDRIFFDGIDDFAVGGVGADRPGGILAATAEGVNVASSNR